ncbi:MAG TPA: hypothetical protein VK601_21755 [Kofleriaceae bacterium]|nr:hypothetical protein [Kofleriaceae bacterium]
MTILMAMGAQTSHAHPDRDGQICSLGAAAVGQMGTVICKNARTGATTQAVNVGATVVGPGGTGGTLSRHDGDVLVTNLAGGAVLLKDVRGSLKAPVALDTGGEGSLSGAISDRGAYVLTGTRLLFFPAGHHRATSSQPLLIGDGSAAQVALAGGYAYVSEKTGTLEAFAIARDGDLDAPGAPVAGVPAGAIVGITGLEDLIVAPVAHLASDANRATVPVASGHDVVQIVPTKEVAACWAAHHDDEVCITNPGSMTVSCGKFGPGGFQSYTSAAANPVGETLLDIDLGRDRVGILGRHNGVPVLISYARDGGDFLTAMSEVPLGAPVATGVLLLPASSR